MPDSLAPTLPFSTLLPALGTSVLIAFATALLSLAGGGSVAVLTFLSGRQRSYGLKAAIFLPLLWPPFLSSIGWMVSLGESGLTLFQRDTIEGTALPFLFSWLGVSLIQSLTYWPIPALFGLWGLSRLDRGLVELVALEGGNRVLLMRLSARLIAGPLGQSAFLVALLSLDDIGTPEMLQVDTFPVVLYTELNVVRELLPLFPLLFPVAGLVMAAGGCWGAARGLLAISQEEARPQERPKATHSWLPLAALIGTLLALGPGVGTSSQIVAAVRDVGTIHWSLLTECIHASILVGAGTVVAMFAALSGLAMIRPGKPGRAVAEIGSFLFLALPAPFLALAVLKGFSEIGDPLARLLDSFWILCLCCALRFLWIGWGLIRFGERQTDPAVWEAARLEGCSRGIGYLGRLHLPMLLPYWAFAAMVVWVLAISEVSFTRILQPPGFQTLAARTINFMHWGHDGMVAAGLLLLAGLEILPWVVGAGLLAWGKRGPNR